MGTGGEFPSSGVLCRDERGGVESVPEPLSPGSISLVLSAQEAGTRFHSRLNAVSKTYCYRIETAAKKNVFERRYVYGLGEPLDIAAMRRAAAYLTGEHDFKAFCSLKRMKKSTVRNLTAIEIAMRESVCELHFRGNGFLYNMVRIHDRNTDRGRTS